MRTPRRVQLEALARSRGKLGFAFYMEQGLGKTATAIMDFLDHVEMGKVSRMIVYCPNSFKGGWKAEAEEWGFNVDVIIYDANEDHWIRKYIGKGFDKPPILVINFESARTPKGQAIVQFFSAGRSVFGVVDESIALKDHQSAQTKAILAMGQDQDYTRILSGKPITQGPHDLWAQMRYIKHLAGFPFYAFRNAFCKMGGYKQKQVVGALNEDVLAERIDPVVFRATKEEYAPELPPKVYAIRDYVMSPEQKAMYRAMEEEFILWINDDENVSVDAAITKYIKLAQIQCGFILDEKGNTRMLVEPSKNARLNIVEEILNDTIVGKATVVYRHRASFELLMERFRYLNPTYIKGGMATAETEEQKRIFNKEKGSRIMLLQTDAAKYGHTLLGLEGRADHCSSQVFFETSYSLDARSQIEDRSHRYGQLGEVMSYFDICGTPLDRNVIQALQRKESVFKAIFGQIGRKLGPISMQDPSDPGLEVP